MIIALIIGTTAASTATAEVSCNVDPETFDGGYFENNPLTRRTGFIGPGRDDMIRHQCNV